LGQRGTVAPKANLQSLHMAAAGHLPHTAQDPKVLKPRCSKFPKVCIRPLYCASLCSQQVLRHVQQCFLDPVN
jgi:hypothetical protein